MEALGHISEYGLEKLKTRNYYCVSVSRQPEKEFTIGIVRLSDAEARIDRLTVALAEVQKDRDYWKVEAEGERAKVAFRDKRLAEAVRERDNAQLAYEAMRDHRALKEKP